MWKCKGNFILKNSLTKKAKTCPFLNKSDFVALHGIVRGVKILSFSILNRNLRFAEKIRRKNTKNRTRIFTDGADLSR